MSAKGCDFQNSDFNFIVTNKQLLPHPRGTEINDSNFLEIAVYFAVRHCINQSWLNNQDQFYAPQEQWETDICFIADCIAFTLFHEKNRISATQGTNHWIPFTEAEVDAKEKFSSHFMSDFIRGKLNCRQTEQQIDIFETKPAVTPIPAEPLRFSPVAQMVMDVGRALWRYYHAQPDAIADASFYDIKLHFQGRNAQGKMNSDSDDATYTELIGTLRQNLKLLAKQIEPKVYEYGFLKR